MKANSPDRNENGPAKGRSVETMPLRIEEVNFLVEENEEIIAADEEITIRTEKIENIIAASNHNPTTGRDSE